MVNNKDFINYYDIFTLDRSWTEKQLKKALGAKQAEAIKLKGSTNRDDTETLNTLQNYLEMAREAIKILGKPESRRQYDIELDKAIREGRVTVEVEAEIRNALDKARQYFEKGQYRLAKQFAQEALDNHINSDEPYEIISRSEFFMGDYDDAIHTLEIGTEAFNTSLNLCWLNIRFLIMMEKYNEAQQKLNEGLIRFNNSSMLKAEQVYLYGYAEKFDMVKKTIKDYLNDNPSDMDYRRYVANNLFDIAQMCYVYDTAAEIMLITEEDAYNRCLELITLANEIYQDEGLRSELDYVKQFGVVEFDKDHLGLKSFYHIVGAIAILIGLFNLQSFGMICIIIGVLMQGAGMLVNKCSYRPYWKIYRDMYRGVKEQDEGLLYNILSLPFMFWK